MRAQLLLADQVYLTVHDDARGRARVHGRAIGLVLAGALLGELMLFGRITTHGGLVVVVAPAPPADALAHVVLDDVLGERQRLPLRTWIAYLGQTATARVAVRLNRAGHLLRVNERRLFRVETRWVPTDMTVAATPGAVLRHQLERETRLDDPEALFAGLVHAAGLDPVVLWALGSRGLQYRDWRLDCLDAPLRELVAETKAAIGATVLTHRT